MDCFCFSEILYYTVFSNLLIVKSIWKNIWIRENISHLGFFMKRGKSEKRLVSKIEGAQFYLSRDPLSRTRHTQNEHRSFQVSASFFPRKKLLFFRGDKTCLDPNSERNCEYRRLRIWRQIWQKFFDLTRGRPFVIFCSFWLTQPITFKI